MNTAKFSCTNRLQTSALVRVPPTWAQVDESALPKLGSRLALPDVKGLGGSIWTPQNSPANALVVY